jgi:type IV pilus assembly protein PilB
VATKLKIPAGCFLLDVTLAFGVVQRVLFCGYLYDLYFRDITLFKAIKENNATVPVDFEVGDIEMLTVIDDFQYDQKSLIGMTPFFVTMNSGKTHSIHCFRVKKASWIVGMLEGDQGLKKVFVNNLNVSKIERICDVTPADQEQDGEGAAWSVSDYASEKISEEFDESLFVKQELAEFDLVPIPAVQDERFRPLLAHLEKHGIVVWSGLIGFLGIDPARLRQKVRIGDFLVREGLMAKENLEKGLAFRKSNKELLLGEILVELGYISEFVLGLALAVQFRLPFTILAPEKVEKEAARLFSAQRAREYEAIPFKLHNNQLTVAVADPGLEGIQELSFILNKNISLVVASRQDVRATIAYIYGNGKDISPLVTTQEQSFYFDVAGAEEESVDAIVARGKEAPIVALVNQIINEGVERNASDIHITPGKKLMTVGYRVNGIIYEARTIEKHLQTYVVARIKILGGMDIIERRLPQDGLIHGRARNQTVVDIRVSIIPAKHGETVVLRLRYPDKRQPDLVDLGFTEEHLALVRAGLARSKGIILVTGPTGSGKSTTLVSFLNAIRELALKLHIITVEDPVELEVPGITQIPVNSAIGMTFPRVLRNIMRHDPDVIMVGEIRDEETARVAVQAALTGHLVLSTLHTNDAITTITRLEDMGIESFLVNTAVNMVIAQRLVKNLCDCAESYRPDSSDLELLTGFGMSLPAGKTLLRRPQGCPKCNQSGFAGRIMIYEILLLDTELRDLNLREVCHSGSFRQLLAKKGFIPLIKHGLAKVLAGEVYLPEVMQHWDG